MYSDLDDFEDRTPPSGDEQTSQSQMSSQTVVGTSADPDTVSFKRKRDISPSDCARSLRPFMAGSDGDNLPHYLTVSPNILRLFSYVEFECRFLKAGNLFYSKPKVYLA